jgi:hypothetical protein
MLSGKQPKQSASRNSIPVVYWKQNLRNNISLISCNYSRYIDKTYHGVVFEYFGFGPWKHYFSKVFTPESFRERGLPISASDFEPHRMTREQIQEAIRKKKEKKDQMLKMGIPLFGKFNGNTHRRGEDNDSDGGGNSDGNSDEDYESDDYDGDDYDKDDKFDGQDNKHSSLFHEVEAGEVRSRRGNGGVQGKKKNKGKDKNGNKMRHRNPEFANKADRDRAAGKTGREKGFRRKKQGGGKKGKKGGKKGGKKHGGGRGGGRRDGGVRRPFDKRWSGPFGR